MRRRAGGLAVALALLVLPGVGWAAGSGAVPVFLSGFELATTTTDSWGRTSFELTTTTNSASAHVNLCKAGGTSPDCAGFVHNASNGGDASSHWALRSVVAAGANAATASPTAPTPVLPQTTLSVGVAVHLDASVPTSARTFLATADASGPLCSVAVNPDRTLALYARGTLVATTTATLAQFACSQDPTIPCQSDADCGGTNHCGLCTGGTPGTPCTNASDGSGAYFAGLELTTIAATPSLTCQLWVNGTRQASVLTTPSVAPAAVTQVLLGWSQTIIGGDTAAGTIDLDDLVLATSARAGFGAVAVAVPGHDGGTNQWSQNNCTGSHFGCVDDYGASPFTLDSARLQTGLPSKTETFACPPPVGTCRGLGPTPVLPSGASVPAVEAVVIVSSSTNNGTRDLEQDLGACTPGTGCVYESAPNFTVGVNQPAQVGARRVRTTDIVAGSAWTLQDLQQLAYRIRTLSDHSALTRAEAVAAYIRVERPTPTLLTLHDRNAAAPGDPALDGKLVVACYGDSTTFGTAATTCSGGTLAGQPCSQGTYCTFSALQDLPTGGCAAVASCTLASGTRCGAAADATCQTCVGRRNDFNAGGGYPCGPNNGGATCDLGCTNPNSSGVCTTDSCTGSTSSTPCAGLPQSCTGTCPGDPSVGCNVPSDCNLGLCDTCDTPKCAGGSNNTPTDYCAVSCPPAGVGTCPNQHTSWCDQLVGTLGMDVLLRCGFPGETAGGGVNRILGEAVTGLDQQCTALVGAGLGCRCGVGNATTVAEINGQCGPGGTCSCTTPGCDGTCTSGPGATCVGQDCAYCTDNAACSSAGHSDGVCTNGICTTQKSGAQCRQYPADDFVHLEGYNDVAAPPMDPECSGWASASLTGTDAGDLCTGPIVRCTRDADCSSVGSGSRCIGYGASGTGSPTTGCIAPVQSVLQNVGCTERSAPCTTNADCTALGGTTQGGRCVGGVAGASYPLGFCACTADSDCAPGFACVGFTTSISECASTATCVCRLTCTSDADCSPGGTVVGACACPPGYTCPSGHAKVCSGMCSLPAASRACTDATGCQSQQPATFIGQPPHAWTGACVGGGCAHTGLVDCPPACRGNHAQQCGANDGWCLGTGVPCGCDADCAATAPQFNQWASSLVTYALGPPAPGPFFPTADLRDFGWLATVTTWIARLATPAPNYWTVTIPAVNSSECPNGAAGSWYFAALAPAQLSRYPTRVIDARSAVATADIQATHADTVHFSQLGSQLIGQAVAAVLGSRNVCATGRCTAPGQVGGAMACGVDADCPSGQRCNQQWLASPSLYCRNSDGSWTQTSCTVGGTQCSATQQCQPKPCVCACVDTADCLHWFGPGTSCVGGQCQGSGGADACTRFGASFTCAADGVCRDGSGADVCQSPTVLDACNPE